VNVVVFVGSVRTALEPPGFAHRALPGRLDLNRCFVAPGEGDEPELASEALELLRRAGPDALVDIHNTSGDTPPCGIGPAADIAHINLVSLFADRYVHSDLRIGALVEATQGDFPGVLVECGRAGADAADAVARKGLDEYLALPVIETQHLRRNGMEVLDRMVRVCLSPGTKVVFRDRPVSGVDLTIRDDVDRHNFEALAPGTPLGWVDLSAPWPLQATGADGRDRSRDLFAIRHGVLTTRRETIPIMMTTNAESVANDCLFYLAHRRVPSPDRHDSAAPSAPPSS
jgi:hypothetical protein